MTKNFLKYLLTITVISFIQSCSKGDKIEDGLFLTDDNEIFYGIEISDNQSLIKFFILNNWSSSMSKDEIEKQKNIEGFRTAQLIFENNEYKVINIETDFFESKNDTLEISNSSHGIKINCKRLIQAFMGSFPSINDNKMTINLGKLKCPDDEIYFKKKNKTFYNYG